MTPITRVLSVAALSTAFAGSAFAATVDVEKQYKSAFGTPNWSVATSFVANGTTVKNVGAGVFRLKGTYDDGSMSTFLAFCLQPLETLTLPKTHTIATSLDAGVLNNLYALASNAWTLVKDAKSAAAFQMAAWELTTDDGDFDIDAGNFKIIADTTASNNAEAKAQMWLDNIQSDFWKAGGDTFEIYSAKGTQDLLTNLTPVPVPASGLMLLGGLALAGGVARRKTARKDA
ncbi:hypothetical protein [Tropicimonas sp. S265A]|uniref:hypothetical protein n=1 Tax=Tropicimonas sp. S265A TaxID=3415134 RepID=UPI003C7AB82A